MPGASCGSRGRAGHGRAAAGSARGARAALGAGGSCGRRLLSSGTLPAWESPAERPGRSGRVVGAGLCLLTAARPVAWLCHAKTCHPPGPA